MVVVVGSVDLKIWVTVHVQTQSWISFAKSLAGVLIGRNRWKPVEEEVEKQLLSVVGVKEFQVSFPNLEEIWVSFWSDDHFSLEAPAVKLKRRKMEIEVGSITFEERFIRKIRGTGAQAGFLKECVLLQFASDAKSKGNLDMSKWLEEAFDLSNTAAQFKRLKGRSIAGPEI